MASALLYFVGLPGVNVWPVAFVAPVPLLVAIEGRTPRAAAAVGMTSGFVMSLTGFSWLLGTIERFSGMSRPVCLLQPESSMGTVTPPLASIGPAKPMEIV